jgi:hypothetical protein
MFACTNFTSTSGKNSMQQFLEEIGASTVVIALSVARIGDALGTSIIFTVIPLYIAKLQSHWFPRFLKQCVAVSSHLSMGS